MTQSYNRQKQIFATSFDFGIYIYKERYFYRSTFILRFFFFSFLLLYIQIQRYTRKASKRLHLNRISSVNDNYIYIGNRTYLRFSITVLHFHRPLNICQQTVTRVNLRYKRLVIESTRRKKE